MDPVVQAAWIGLIGIGIGVGGTVVVARVGFTSTKNATEATNTSAAANIKTQIEASSADIRAQIEADRLRRVWEKRADVYTDLIAAIQHRDRIRQDQSQGMVPGPQPERPPLEADWFS